MRQIGDYQIEDSVLSTGGTSSVFRAWNRGAPFALKLYNAPGLESGLLRSFFEKEVASLAGLSHPNVIRLHDHGYSDVDSAQYVVLEWLPFTLSDYVASHDADEVPLRWWDSFMPDIGLPLLEALVFAHERGVVHRDIKPSNLLVSEEGTPQLADFGIARIATDTMTVSDFRSVAYAPPEGHRDEQSDLFSLGISYVELLAGDAWDLAEVDRSVRVARAIDSCDIHPRAAEFLRRMTAEDRAKRFRTAGQAYAFADALQSKRHRIDTPHKLTVHVALTHRVGGIIGPSFDVHRKEQRDEAVAKDLEGLRADQRHSEEHGLSYRLYGAEFTYIARKTDDTRHPVLLLVDAWPTTAFDLDAADAAVVLPDIRVTAKRPEDGSASEQALQDFASEVSRHQAERDADRRAAFEHGKLNEWDAILTARETLEHEREKPLDYVEFEDIGEGRIAFTLDDPVEEQDVVDQTRTVAGRSRYQGIVEAVDDRRLILRTTRGVATSLDQRGKLKVDRWLSQSAIRRERNALETLKSQLSVRPDLRGLLADASTARKATVSDIEVIDTQLDEPKRHAIGLATGPADLLAIEGPPGTGKTRLIAELVAQDKRKRSRILLSAQSHAAVDNALERLEDTDMTIVRIGRQESITPEVFRRYHIDGALARWTNEVAANSGAGLNEWADDHRIDDGVRALLSFGYDLSRSEADLEELDGRVVAAGELETILQEALENPESPPIIPLDTSTIAAAGINPDELAPRSLPDTVERLQLVLGHFETLVESDSAMRKQHEDLCGRATELAQHPITSSTDLKALAEVAAGSADGTIAKYERLSEIRGAWLSRFGTNSEFRTLLLASADVVAGTCVGIAAVPEVLETEFDRVIIDEASKASPTETLVPMVRGKKWILLGDTKQLPPYVDSDLMASDSSIDRSTLEQTIFGQLLKELPAENRVLLSSQHRMVPDVGNLISECFYDGKITSTREQSEFASVLQVFDPPVKWLSTSGMPERREQRHGTSFSNPFEIKVIAQYLQDLDQVAGTDNEQPSVVVLCGYSAQRFALRRRLSSLALTSVTVGVYSVDEFQGQERDIAIYSTVRSNAHGVIGFLSSTERLNVALSRGRDALVIVGDAKHMLQSTTTANPFIDVLRYIEGDQDGAWLSELRYG